jgi:putative peptide zinc metalloprotease protein
MTALREDPRAGAAASPVRDAAAPRRDTRDTPTRADGVQLIGEMRGSGYHEPPALARRGDGQTLQLSPLLYLVLSAADGQRDHEQIAAAVSRAYGRTVSGDNVRRLVQGKLRPLGLLKTADGAEPELKRSNPLLALRFKYAVTDPDRTRRLTAPFARLFHPLVVVTVLAAFAVVAWWVLLDKGLASATYQAFDRPALLLLVFAVTVLSAGFHEFGHAAGARYGGATPGVMGAGIYLVWPAFYTDVTDSYRLGRAGRLRTDLGGLYFNAIVAVAVAGVWWATRYDALLLVVATQVLQMVRQLTPLVRFDGYHVLADLTGVPDLFHRIKPTLLSLLPWRWKDPAASVLKPWARAVVTAWVLVVVPMLLFSLTMMVLALPRVLATAWAKVHGQAGALTDAWGHGDLVEAAARGLAIVALAFPILATFVVLVRVLKRAGRSVWRRTSGNPARRAAALGVAGALVAGLAWAWWPHPGTYRPIRPYERGSLLDGVAALPAAAPLARPAATTLRPGSTGRLTTLWPADDPMPTADAPRLAVVLVPHGSATASRTGTATDGSQPDGWVFPFDKPLQPGAGDNQALAVNTTDDTATYDVAFALVWADGSEPATNTNEAYAAASCSRCAAVAVAFQVVMVLGPNHVAAPQNLSVAVNYNCVNCLTYALAQQLFVTLDRPLSDASMARLEDIWRRLGEFGAHLGDVPLSQIQQRLDDFESQILAVVRADQPLPGATPSAAAMSGTGAPSPDASASAGVSDSPTAQASDAAAADGPSAASGPSTGGSASGGAASSQPTPASDSSAQATASATPTQAASTATP